MAVAEIGMPNGVLQAGLVAEGALAELDSRQVGKVLVEIAIEGFYD